MCGKKTRKLEILFHFYNRLSSSTICSESLEWRFADLISQVLSLEVAWFVSLEVSGDNTEANDEDN